MFCKNCGEKIIHSNTEHCSNCGASLKHNVHAENSFWDKASKTVRWKKIALISGGVLFVIFVSFGLASAKYGYRNISSLILHGHFEQKTNSISSNSSSNSITDDSDVKPSDSNPDSSSLLSGSSSTNKETASSNNTGGTSSKTSSGYVQPTQSSARPKPICDSAIVAMPSTVELNQKVNLMASEMLFDSVVWSGGGSFENASKSNTTWSSNVGGNYTLTLTAKNESGECSSSAKVTVSGNLSRIDGLSYVRSYSASNNGIAIYFDIFYLDQNGTALTNRTTTMPISASVSIYKNVSGAKGDQVYNNNFSNSQITTSGYRRITIPNNQINSSQIKDLIVEYTVNTPEQGSFSTSFNIY